MKLDEIKDIEVLKKELKKHMAKCIKSTEDGRFNAGEYYYVDVDIIDGTLSVHDATDGDWDCWYLSEKEFEEYFGEA